MNKDKPEFLFRNTKIGNGEVRPDKLAWQVTLEKLAGETLEMLAGEPGG